MPPGGRDHLPSAERASCWSMHAISRSPARGEQALFGRDRVVIEDHPRVRGNASGQSSRTVGTWDHPAGAGSTTAFWCCSGTCRDHPRERGEHASFRAYAEWMAGPPRGARTTGPCVRVGSGTWDHPRGRGEQVENVPANAKITGSPPRARRAQVVRVGAAVRTRITPASAGSTGVGPCYRQVVGDHPRGPRGAHPRPGRGQREVGVTPAGAGSTLRDLQLACLAHGLRSVCRGDLGR